MEPKSIWKLVVVIAVLLVFICVGIANVIKPRLSPWQRGGEMLTDFNRLQVRLVGAIFAGGAIYLLYVVLRDMTSAWKMKQ
jgi:hypothetical protein